MVTVKFYDKVEDSLLKFAVIVSRHNGKWILCQHKDRNTYEWPGGHREKGEDILDCAKRELWEETGAVRYSLSPVCVYSVVENSSNVTDKISLNNCKFECFFENAKLLQDKFEIVPLMYGSLGLEYLTMQNLNSDDIDILIPKKFITEMWFEFKSFLEHNGYILIDEHEHTFEKNGVLYSYAEIEELQTFADIPLKNISVITAKEIHFKLLSLQQYLNVYTASAKDGYRLNIREKKDLEKISFIKSCLLKEKETFGMLYYAEIEEFEQLPQLEIERIEFFDHLPDDLQKWTYSTTQPKLADKVKKNLNIYR